MTNKPELGSRATTSCVGLRRFHVVWIAMTIAFALTGESCGPRSPDPPRPPNLPAEAIYVGGLDGGQWASCEGSEDGALHCSIYDSASGQVRYESWFRYCPRLGT